MTIGLDYSLSSPSCCIGDSDDIRDCFVFCYAQTKKMLPLADFIKMKYYPEWQSAEERHYKLAKDNSCIFQLLFLYIDNAKSV